LTTRSAVVSKMVDDGSGVDPPFAAVTRSATETPRDGAVRIETDDTTAPQATRRIVTAETYQTPRASAGGDVHPRCRRHPFGAVREQIAHQGLFGHDDALGLRLELSVPGLRRGRPNPVFALYSPRQHWFYPLVTDEPRPASATADDFAWLCLHVMAAQVWWRRQHAGWSDEYAARQWGLSAKTLRRLEYGEDWPSLRALSTVADCLGADLVLAPALSDWRPMPWQRASRTTRLERV